MEYEKIINIINKLNDFIVGNILIWGLLGAGAYLSFILGFPQLKNLKYGLKEMFKKNKQSKSDNEVGSMSSFQALATAIAAQVGTGNVAGVATAITLGGAGSIFWMWISSFLGMGTIFVEAILAQKYRKKINNEYVGGPSYYMSEGLKNIGDISKFFAVFFSVSIIIALGFMGNAVQSNSIAAGIKGIKGLEELNPMIIGIAVALIAAMIFIGGMKRIAKFTELVVPLMAFIYLFSSLIVLIINYDKVIPTFIWIFKSAFSKSAVAGGIAGVGVREAAKRGISRGLFSNEAGMGSTPHAHAVANVKHPVDQGIQAMIGVFTTILICTSTALTILVTRSYEVVGSNGNYLVGAQLTQEAFRSVFGEFGAIILAICLTFFAFTTIVGWYYFGESNIKYLFKDKMLTPYRIIVILFLIGGALQEVEIVWSLADIFNSLMVIPNLIAILLLSKEVKRILTEYNEEIKIT